MKIAYFTNHYPKVSHSFVRREILALERQGFEIERLALRGWADSLPDAEDRAERDRTHYVLQRGAAALIFPALRTMVTSPVKFFAALSLARNQARLIPSRPIAYHLGYLAEACVILSWVRAFGATHIHAHFGTNSAEVAMLTQALGGPSFSFTVHGPDEFLEPMGLAEKVHHSSFVVAVSSFGRSQLCLKLPHRDWPKVRVIHCGIERGFYNVAQRPIPNRPRLVCVGRLSEAKGQLLLIEAVASLAKRGIPIELVLAGDGPMRSELERIISALKIVGHVRITGWISGDEVREEILASRALVLPSFAEGLPVVIMEAMALHRPVLATYIAGIPELVETAKTGWLIPAGSLDALTAAMEDCLSMLPDDLQKLGDNGYHRVIERHSIDTEAAKLGKLLLATQSQ